MRPRVVRDRSLRFILAAFALWGALSPLPSLFSQTPDDLPTGQTPLAKHVERAIDRGAEFLLRNAETGRSGPIFDSYPLGRRALVVYALLESGLDPAHPWIEDSFRRMGEQSLEHVYGVSLYVMALHAWKRSMGVEIGGLQPRTEVVQPQLPGGSTVRDELKRCIEWLVKVRHRGQGAWGYGVLEKRNPWTDYSNTQFAALALHVGVLEGIDIPRTVFEELVGSFSTHVFAARDEIEIQVDRAPWIDDDESDEPTGASAGVTLLSRPMSWGYRPLSAAERRALRRSGSWGTTSMTAAAVSTLMVAQYGLDAKKRLRGRTAIAIERLVTGGIVELSRAWHPARERTPGSMHRNHYYTLYSLEKAMDLAGVGRLDGVDWYRRQVPHLLNDQAPNGGWGTSLHGGVSFEYSQMATAFTLLFLRRATAQLTVHAAPAITTHDRGDVDPRDRRRVFVEGLGGAIDLDELFARLREDRAGRIFPSARQVVAALPPDERPRLLEWFLPLLRDGVSEPVRRFARSAVADLTGLAESDLDRAVEWFEKWQRLRELAEAPRGDEFVEEIARILAARELGVSLRREALVAFQRTGSLRAVPFLLEALEDRDLSIRTAASRSLKNLTGESYPFDPAGKESERAGDLASWRAWWGTEGEGRVAERSFSRLRQRLERAQSLEERAELRAEVIALGATVLPFVEKVIAEGSYAFDWLLVRESLGGEAGIPLR